jgi:cyanophycinase
VSAAMSPRRATGSLVLVGGGEWGPGARDFDADLLARSGADEVLVLPTAAAYEHPDRVGEKATTYFADLGAKVRTLPVLHRAEAEDPTIADTVRAARFVYLADGSPLHLRSVLKGSALFEAIVASYHGGGMLAASGAGATLLCDPMVDPRGGAYTVGLGVVKDLAVFPYHGTAADHLRERSVDLLPKTAVLAGIDEQTALIKGSDGWSVAGAGAVTLYGVDGTPRYTNGDAVPGLPV